MSIKPEPNWLIRSLNRAPAVRFVRWLKRQDPSISALCAQLIAWTKTSSMLASALTIADVVGKLAIFYTIVTYLADSGERTKAKELQAWQVINTARSGDGGRKLALHDLVEDGVSLDGINLDGAYLFGIELRGADFSHASLRGTDLRAANLSCRQSSLGPFHFGSCWRAGFVYTDLTDANLEGASLYASRLSYTKFARTDGSVLSFGGVDLGASLIEEVNFEHAVFMGSSFSKAAIQESSFQNVVFKGTNFSSAVLKNVHFADTQFGTLTSDERYQVLGLLDATLEPPDMTGTALLQVTFNGHPITPDDLRGVRLCRTRINDTLINRDCAP